MEGAADSEVGLSVTLGTRAPQPADPTRVVIVGLGLQLEVERCEHLPYEDVVAVPWERVVGEQQDAEVRLSAIQPKHGSE